VRLYNFSFFQGRLAIEWVITKLDLEVKELTSHARKSTDDFIKSAKKSLDSLSSTTGEEKI
jgi:hypothetical protein